jgi:DNA-binding XRE family transcriptional regulator
MKSTGGGVVLWKMPFERTGKPILSEGEPPKARALQWGCSPFSLTLGERLREKRVNMGLTNVQIAKRLGVAYQTIEKWEHNRNAISRENRALILAFLESSNG